MQTLDADTFDAVTAKGVHLISFSANWCAPCAAMQPLLDEFAAEGHGRYSVAKVDIEVSPKLAESHHVRSVPTLVVFKDGAECRRVVGAKGRRQLGALIGDLLDE